MEVINVKVSELDFFLDDFLAFCQSKNLSTKTLSSYEQSLKLFLAYLKNEHEIEKVNQVKTGHIRQYVAYIQELMLSFIYRLRKFVDVLNATTMIRRNGSLSLLQMMTLSTTPSGKT
jgi:site-specific recombinase XerD